MTDVVIPSRDRNAVANAEQTLKRHGNITRIIPNTERLVELPEQGLSSGALDGFDEDGVTTSSNADFELTVKSGEALIEGAYVARDTTTTVEEDYDNGSATIAVGWLHDQPDSIVIQRADRFGGRDRKTDLWIVEDNSGTPQIKTFGGDQRQLDERYLVDEVQARDRLTAPDEDDVRLAGGRSTPGSSANSVAGDVLIDGLFGNPGGSVKITSGDGGSAGGPGDISLTTGSGSLGFQGTISLDAKQIDGTDSGSLVVPKRGDDPSSPPDGAIWYRTDLDEYRGVENGNEVTFDTTTV